MKHTEKAKSFDYKWIIVGVCFLTVFVCLGFCSSNKSIYVAAITNANGFPRGLYAIGDACRYAATAFVNIFFGGLVAKYGTKKLMLCGFVSLIFANLLYSVARTVFGFYIGGFLLGIGFSFTTTAMVGCVVNKWFTENKGTVMGIILSANGLGSLVAVQILNPVIHRQDTAFGYRDAYRLTALILLATMLIAAVFMREKQTPPHQTEAGGKSRGKRWVGPDYRTAVRKRYFWITAVCIFFTGFMLQGITGVAAAHMEDVRLDPGFITVVLSVGSVTLTVSKFLTGFIYDRLGLRFTVALCSVSAVVTMFSLVFLNHGLSGKITAMCYAVVSSLALPLETIMLPIYAADLFGEKAFDKILGVFVSVNTLGFALGSFFVNLIYDVSGSYVPAFAGCGILMVVVAVVMQFVIRAANEYKKTFVAELSVMQR